MIGTNEYIIVDQDGRSHTFSSCRIEKVNVGITDNASVVGIFRNGHAIAFFHDPRKVIGYRGYWTR